MPAYTVTPAASQRTSGPEIPWSKNTHTMPAMSAAAAGLGIPVNQRLSATLSCVLKRASRSAAPTQ